MKVSIITVCYNAERCLEKAIQSVLNQTYKDIEYIIVDGQSMDGTMSIVNKYKDRIAKVISEKDKGIYDAMNKGIKSAHGDILYFVNSDDALYNNFVIENVANAFQSSPTIDVVYGKVETINIPAEILFCFDEIFTGNLEFKSKWDVLKHQPCHQCIFVKKEVFKKIGLFNEGYKIAADLDWILRIVKYNVSIKFIDTRVSFFDFQGLSYQKRNSTAVRERYQVIFRNSSLVEFLCYSTRRVYLFIKYGLKIKLRGIKFSRRKKLGNE